MSEFKIAGPGFYRTRDGRRVEVELVSKYNISLPVIGGFVGESESRRSWALNGKRYHPEYPDPYPEDLVSEWEETLYEWAFLNGYSGWRRSTKFMTESEALEHQILQGYSAKRRLNQLPGEGLKSLQDGSV